MTDASLPPRQPAHGAARRRPSGRSASAASRSCRCASSRARSESATARRGGTSPIARRCSTRSPRPASSGSAPSCATAVDGAGEEFEPRLRATAAAYIRFATADAALLELMFAGKHREPDRRARRGGRARLRGDARADPAGSGRRRARAGDPERVGLVLFATIQGIAAIVVSAAAAGRGRDRFRQVHRRSR